MRSAIDIVTTFGKYAGTVLNMSKCEGLWLGRFKERQKDCTLFNIKWPSEPIRCLGIYVGHNIDENQALNWTSKLDDVRKLLNRWKQRKLTIFGKVLIIKQLAIPKVLFSATNLPIPDNFIQQLDTLFYDFIWGNTEKVKRCVLINDLEKGGIKMIDTAELFRSVKAAWVPRLLHAHDSDLWTTVAKHYLNYHNDDHFIFKMGFTDKKNFDFIKQIPPFYKEVLCAFNKAKQIDITVFCQNILVQPLWGNDFISCKYEGKVKSLYYKNWMDAGILKVSNLRFIDGVLDEHFIYTKVLQKRNIFSEISRLKQALKPYEQYIGDHEPVDNNYIPLFYILGKVKDEFKDTKSKIFYRQLISSKVQIPTKEEKWKLRIGIDNVNFNHVYRKKIVSMFDRKIAEFNYKILQDILPCNVNLVKWRKSNNTHCRLCNVEETIEHLLYDCKFAKAIWAYFKDKTGINVNVEDVIFGNYLSEIQNVIVSITAYYIFKCWLLESYNNVQRHNVNSQSYILDLKYRYNTYMSAERRELCESISQIIR